MRRNRSAPSANDQLCVCGGRLVLTPSTLQIMTTPSFTLLHSLYSPYSLSFSLLFFP